MYSFQLVGLGSALDAATELVPEESPADHHVEAEQEIVIHAVQPLGETNAHTKLVVTDAGLTGGIQQGHIHGSEGKRITVHDEVDGDVPSDEHAARVAEVLNAQSFPLRVPITWEVETAANWRAGWRPKEVR